MNNFDLIDSDIVNGNFHAVRKLNAHLRGFDNNLVMSIIGLVVLLIAFPVAFFEATRAYVFLFYIGGGLLSVYSFYRAWWHQRQAERLNQKFNITQNLDKYRQELRRETKALNASLDR